MKKNILLLIASALMSLGTAQAAQNITKCYGQNLTMTATKTGNSYQWYKDGVKISGATAKSYTANNLSANAKYTCEITTNGSTANTGNMISLGNFEWTASASYKRYSETINDPIRNESYTINYELDNLQVNQANSGEYTTTTNPNLIKPQYFSSISAHEGSKMLIVDCAASSTEFKVFHVRDLKLKKGQTYQFSCWAANVDMEYFTKNHGTQSLPKIKFVIEADGHGTQVLGGGYMTLTDELGVWKEYKATFTPSQDCNWAHITIFNTTNTTVAGNDFVLDGLYFGAEKKTGSSTEKEDFNVTVYDTFEYDFKTVEVCPGAQATITTTLVPAHGGTLEPAANYKYEWKLNGTTPVVSTDKNLQVTAPNTVGSESYVLSTSSTVCYNSGAKSQTTSVKTKDCGRTVPVVHPAVTVCPENPVTLSCDNFGNVRWSHNAGIADGEITVLSSSEVGKEEKYNCTITTTENGNTVIYEESFTIKTKDCTRRTTMCNVSADSTLTTEKKGDEYIWTLPDGSTQKAVLDNIRISHLNATVGSKFAYSCEIWDVPASSPLPSGALPTLLAVEFFEITITDCAVNTFDEQTKQVEKGGSITLFVPEENRCNECEYKWYKKVDGNLVEVDKNPVDKYPYEHTIDNVDESEYVCEVIKPTGEKHTETYKIEILDTISICYDAASEEQQLKEIVGATGATSQHTWYIEKDGNKVPFPDGSVTTENNILTLDPSYFASANKPTEVKIIHEYEKIGTSEDSTPEPNPGPQPAPAPQPTPEPQPAPENKLIINCNFENVLSQSQYNGDKTIIIDEYTQFIISDNYKYAQTFDSKSDGMAEHDGVLRVINKGLGDTTPAEGKDNNNYLLDIDGGSKEGAIFTIKSTGNYKAGETYLFTYLFINTNSTTSVNAPELECTMTTNTGEFVVLTPRQKIENDYWHTWNKLFKIEQDAESVEITFSNYCTASGQNDFALDNIELTTDIPEYLQNAEPRSFTLRAETIETWTEEITLVINPVTHQDIIETASPDKEHESEVKLTYNANNEYVTFFYNPEVSYTEGMTKYEDYKEATNLYGCTHTVSFTLNLIGITPDKYFTPNNDGIHDKWMIDGIESAPNAHIMIYDRHSKLLYKSIASEFTGWDGNYNGHGMVQDDYWYVILIPETNETLSGHFTLKR